MITIIGGDFTRSWLSLPLSHSTKAKGQKNILVIPHSSMEIPKCLLSAPDLRAAPCKNEAQQRQDHTWYKHPGSFVDDEPEPGSFCDPFPKMVATDLWHFKTCQSMPWKLCFHLAQQESWNNLEQLGTTWNNPKTPTACFDLISEGLELCQRKQEWKLQKTFNKPSTRAFTAGWTEPSDELPPVESNPTTVLASNSQRQRENCQTLLQKEHKSAFIASRVSAFSFLSVLLSSTLKDITISAAACRVVWSGPRWPQRDPWP